MALPIVLEPVRSQAVAELGYLTEQHTLLVRFAGNRSVYAYFGVPPKHYAGLKASGSIGRYLNQHILRRYPVARLTSGEAETQAA